MLNNNGLPNESVYVRGFTDTNLPEKMKCEFTSKLSVYRRYPRRFLANQTPSVLKFFQAMPFVPNCLLQV